jgi:ABC-type multidrug transport system permease subunit
MYHSTTRNINTISILLTIDFFCLIFIYYIVLVNKALP